ncbi:MAG: hypothetical protein JWM04_1799, partial [Verrucomicrobiales bacterium]|nr:hypothetical protein [Verrucomicrobiales bacterium]
SSRMAKVQISIRSPQAVPENFDKPIEID